MLVVFLLLFALFSVLGIAFVIIFNKAYFFMKHEEESFKRNEEIEDAYNDKLKEEIKHMKGDN